MLIMENVPDGAENDDTIWHVGVFDSHCHPTDIMASIGDITHMKARSLTIMASRSQDQDLVAETASKYPLKAQTDLMQNESHFVVPAFGWHPWFSHQIYDDRANAELTKIEHYQRVLTPPPDEDDFLHSLPTPIPLSKFIEDSETRLRMFPVALVGEIGLDRAFRLPVGSFSPPGQPATKTSQYPDGEYTPGAREGRSLTPYHVSMDHQKTILRAQLELAAKLCLPVSIHSVQAHGVVFEVLQNMWAGHEKVSRRQQKRRRSVDGAHDADDELIEDENTSMHAHGLPFPPRICMHSYSGPVDPLRQFLHPSVPAEVFFSFSQCVNFSTPSAARVINVIKAVPNSQILIESDFHCAGEKMDELLLEIVKRVCEIKGWSLQEGAQILRSNWERFIFG
jgi:Tat protein secretion system quality control protein TatD with DNase activity